MGISVIEDVDSLTELAELGEDYDLWWRLFVAGCFLFPGVVAFLGGGCGAMVVHWLGAHQVAPPAPATSRLHEPYMLLEGRVTPLAVPHETFRPERAE